MESDIVVPGEHVVASNLADERQVHQHQHHHHGGRPNQSKSRSVPLGDHGELVSYPTAAAATTGRRKQQQQQQNSKEQHFLLAPSLQPPTGGGGDNNNNNNNNNCNTGEPSSFLACGRQQPPSPPPKLPGRREPRCEPAYSSTAAAEANSSSGASSSNSNFKAHVVGPSANQLNEKAINNISSSGNSNRRQATTTTTTTSGGSYGDASRARAKPAAAAAEAASNKGLREQPASKACNANAAAAGAADGDVGDEVGYENCAPSSNSNSNSNSNETLSLRAVGCQQDVESPGEQAAASSQQQRKLGQLINVSAPTATTTTTTTATTTKQQEPPCESSSGINHHHHQKQQQQQQQHRRRQSVQLINTTTTTTTTADSAVDRLPPCTCEAIRANRRHLDSEQLCQQQQQQDSDYPISAREATQSNRSVDSAEAIWLDSSGPQNQDNYFWTRLANLTRSITQRHDHRHLVVSPHPSTGGGGGVGGSRPPAYSSNQRQQQQQQQQERNSLGPDSPPPGSARSTYQDTAAKMTAASESEAVGGQAGREANRLGGSKHQVHLSSTHDHQQQQQQQPSERRHSSAVVSQQQQQQQNISSSNQQQPPLDTRLTANNSKLQASRPAAVNSDDSNSPASKVSHNQEATTTTATNLNNPTTATAPTMPANPEKQIKLSIATTTTTTTNTNTKNNAAATTHTNRSSVSSSLSSCILSESSRSSATSASSTRSGARLKWGKKMDFLLSIIGFAVDLANIWRFPYLVYKNGGGVFLIPYGTMLVFGGIPLFFLELCLGQYVKKGPITVWNKICPSMKGVGYCSILISWYVSFYYNVLIAWSVYFIYRSLLSMGDAKMPWEDCDNSWNSKAGECVSISQLKSLCSMKNESLEACRKEMFASVNVTSPASEFFVKELSQIDQSRGLDDMGYLRLELVLCTMIVYLLHYFSLFRGLETSGKVVWVTATAPYMILSILLIRGLFLPGAAMGIEYYLSPKLEKLADPQVWIDAAGQVFYSIGVGFGVHLTYASFNSHDNNCYRDCLMTSAVNAATSVYSGLVVFVYLGYMATNLGIEIDKVASEGYSLVFEVYPEALTTLPFARFWSILFFIMLLTLGIDSAMGGLEAVITGLEDEFKFARRLSRAQLTGLVIVSSFLPALISCTQGGAYTLFWFDIYSAGVSLLFSALFETIGVVYCYGLDKFILNIESMLGRRPHLFFILCWKYISPVFLGVVIFMSLYTASVPVYRGYTFPLWSIIAGWCLAFSSVAAIPIVALWTWFDTSRRSSSLEKRKRASGTDSVASGAGGKHGGGSRATKSASASAGKHQFKSITVSCNSNNTSSRGQGPFCGSTTTTTVLESSPLDHHHNHHHLLHHQHHQQQLQQHYPTDSAAMMPTRISEDML